MADTKNNLQHPADDTAGSLRPPVSGEETTPAPEPEPQLPPPGQSDAAAAPDMPPPETADAVSPGDDAAHLRDQLLRLQADFDNYRKRVARDDAARARRATENLVNDLLPVLDHFEMGLKAARAVSLTAAVYDGLMLVQTQLLDVLKKAGVVPVEASGAAFDPQCHECIAHLPSVEFAEGMIIDVTRRGYWLGDYLLRPAQVVVSSGIPASPEPGMDADVENSMAGPLDSPA